MLHLISKSLSVFTVPLVLMDFKLKTPGLENWLSVKGLLCYSPQAHRHCLMFCRCSISHSLQRLLLKIQNSLCGTACTVTRKLSNCQCKCHIAIFENSWTGWIESESTIYFITTEFLLLRVNTWKFSQVCNRRRMYTIEFKISEIESHISIYIDICSSNQF